MLRQSLPGLREGDEELAGLDSFDLVEPVGLVGLADLYEPVLAGRLNPCRPCCCGLGATTGLFIAD